MTILKCTSCVLGFSLLVAALTGACRNADEATAAGFFPSAHGANGCRGPDQVFTPPQTPSEVALTKLAIAPTSRITAAAGGELLYATGANATVVAIDVTGATPVEEVLVEAPTVQNMITLAGVSGAPELGAIAVLDLDRLLVVEITSHTVLSVERLPPHAVAFYAGLPASQPGNADGFATGSVSVARFGFDADSALCPTGGLDSVFVADSGNHSIRWIHFVGGTLGVDTLSGTGTPGFADGPLSAASFDVPSGLSLACNGTLILSERGSLPPLVDDEIFFGNRIRQLEVGSPSFFGGFMGAVTTIVGSGVDATTNGIGEAAAVSKPLAPLVTGEGEIYWIDSGTGTLRRRKLDNTADCPLFADCASAVLTPTFPRDHALSLTGTDGGNLYVLDATAGVLYRVTP